MNLKMEERKCSLMRQCAAKICCQSVQNSNSDTALARHLESNVTQPMAVVNEILVFSVLYATFPSNVREGLLPHFKKTLADAASSKVNTAAPSLVSHLENRLL